MTKEEKEKLINEYKKVYLQANGKEAPEFVFYHGWIRFRGYHSKFRLSDLPEMINRLRQRVNDASL